MEVGQNGSWCVCSISLIDSDLQRCVGVHERPCRSGIGSQGGDRAALRRLEMSSESLTRVMDLDLLRSRDGTEEESFQEIHPKNESSRSEMKMV